MADITISDLEKADEALDDMLVAVDGANKTQSLTLKQLKKYLGSALPTGFVIASLGKIDDIRFKQLDGSQINKEGIYSDFYAKVVKETTAGNWPQCTKEEYENDLTTYGQCGKFVVESDYVRIPKITAYLGATLSLSELGKAYKESLPNFQGEIGIISRRQPEAYFPLYVSNHITIRNSGGLDGFTPDLGAGQGQIADINLSNASKTYQDGAKVHPDNIKVFYYMVVATDVQVEDIEADIKQVLKELEAKADKNGGNFTIDGKKAITSFMMPDYDRAESLTANAPFTPDDDSIIELSIDVAPATFYRISIGDVDDPTKAIVGSNVVGSWSQQCIVKKGLQYYFACNATIQKAVLIPLTASKGV